MKSYIYVIFSFLSFHHFCSAQNYWIESTDLDSLMLINKGVVSSFQGYSDNTYFNIEVEEGEEGEEVYLKPQCTKCSDSISLKLWGKKEDAYTQWIYLNPGDSIAINTCFDQYPEASNLSRLYSTVKEKVVAFWKSLTGGGRMNSIKIPRLKSGKSPQSDEPKMSFSESDYFRYMSQSDFLVPFTIAEKHPVKSIYIISHKGELILCSGNSALVKKVFSGLKPEQVPPLSTTLKERCKKEKEIKYELLMDNIAPYFLEPLVSGVWYQVGIELENDETDFNPYLFNFRFYTPEDLSRLNIFANE